MAKTTDSRNAKGRTRRQHEIRQAVAIDVSRGDLEAVAVAVDVEGPRVEEDAVPAAVDPDHRGNVPVPAAPGAPGSDEDVGEAVSVHVARGDRHARKCRFSRRPAGNSLRGHAVEHADERCMVDGAGGGDDVGDAVAREIRVGRADRGPVELGERVEEPGRAIDPDAVGEVADPVVGGGEHARLAVGGRHATHEDQQREKAALS
jgi:hypothetical protein